MPQDPAAAVAALLDRYLISLDDEKLDDTWARNLFTPDGTVEFPMSRHAGVDGMAAYHATALSAFAATHHLGSPAVVDVDGGRARLRANLISVHVHHGTADGAPSLFVTGTFVVGEARRTGAGWRLDALSFQLRWASGDPPRPVG